MSILTFPVPETLNTSQLINELNAAGFTEVNVCLYQDNEGQPDHIQVTAAELTDHMPPAEMRDACATQEDLDWLCWAFAEEAFNSDHNKAIAMQAVISEHVASVSPTPLTLEERIEALPNPVEDFEGFRSELASILEGMK